MRAVIVALVVGLVVGGLAVRWFADLPSEVPASRVDEPLAPDTQVERGETRAVHEIAGSERSSAEKKGAPHLPLPDVLITDALRRYASVGITDGWSAVRKDVVPPEDLAEGIKSFEKLVLESPASIGRSLGERRTKAEQALADARTGGVFALLESLLAGGVGPLPGLVHDPKQFEPLFQRASDERALDALSNRLHPDELAEDGVTLSWPGGVFQVENLMWEKNPYPRDVTLAGAGIDKTMLVIGDGIGNDSLVTHGPSLINFAIRDCTVHTNGNYLLHMHTKPVTVRFERVRFIGFDSGGGCSCLLSANALALSASDCRFEGRYGLPTSHTGTLIDVRSDAVLARFEGCRFSLLGFRIWDWAPGASVLFLGCTLDQILDDALLHAEQKPGVVFDGCSFTKFAGTQEEVPHLDLNALFPDWKNRME